MDIVKAGGETRNPCVAYFFLAHAATWIASTLLEYPILRDPRFPHIYVVRNFLRTGARIGNGKTLSKSIETHRHSSKLICLLDYRQIQLDEHQF